MPLKSLSSIVPAGVGVGDGLAANKLGQSKAKTAKTN
jgi:hypothetical protein